MVQRERTGNTPSEVLQFYGDKDPFEDLTFFKHYLASAAASFAEEREPAVLWHSQPSRLRSHKNSKCRRVVYNSENAFAALISGQVEPDSVHINTPTVIVKDSFASSFLQLDPRPSDYVESVKRNLEESIPGELRREYNEAMMQGNPDNNVHSIIIVQVLVVTFFYLKRMGITLHKAQALPLDGICDRILKDIFAKTSSLDEYMKKRLRIKKNGVKASINIERQFETREDLASFMNSEWNVDILLARKALVSLKPPDCLRGSCYLQDALIATEDMSPLQHFLHRCQKDAPQRATRDYITRAAIIATNFGIVSSEYLIVLKRIRLELTRLSRDLHQEPESVEKQNACLNFVKQVSISGNCNFNFRKSNH